MLSVNLAGEIITDSILPRQNQAMDAILFRLNYKKYYIKIEEVTFRMTNVI